MIKVKEFRGIYYTVKNAINEVFSLAKENEKDKNDYYLFLCKASINYFYKENSGANKYIIEEGINDNIDRARLSFFSNYINSRYSFDIFNSSDSETSLIVEMMIYAHLWESKPFLKQLLSLMSLCNKEYYDWNIINKDPKHDITNLKQKAERNGLKSFGDILGIAYNDQYRNAFAHSDFLFNSNDLDIILLNYDTHPKSPTVPHISIDEWTKCFCHSFLLNYHFLNKFEEERKKCSGEAINVLLRDNNGNKVEGTIQFHEETNSFSVHRG